VAYTTLMTYYTSKDLARSFRVVRKNTLQIANEIPETDYAYRATPDTRTIAEMLAHVAAGPRWHHLAHGVEKKTFLNFEDLGRYTQELHAYEMTLKTKPEIVTALEANGEQFAAWLESLDEAVLGELVSFPTPIDPPQKTRFEMLMGVKEHEMHHRAQLMVAQRLLGIVPHLTREREARMAARRT
jgi:uncharacterized damage-inducible protein DinB